MAEPQVPGGDGPDGDVPDAGSATHAEASEQVNGVSDGSGGQRSGQGGEAGAEPAAGPGSAAGAAEDEAVVWPTAEDAVEAGSDASGVTAETDRFAIGGGAGETNATARSAGWSGGAADVPAEAEVERTGSIEPVEEAVGGDADAAPGSGAAAQAAASTEQTQRIPVVPPAAAASGADGAGSVPEESDVERTADIPVVPSGPDPAQSPAAQRPQQVQEPQQVQPPGDARPTQYIPRVEPGAEPAATARPEDFGFGTPAAPGAPAPQDGPTPGGPAQTSTGQTSTGQGGPDPGPAASPERAGHPRAGQVPPAGASAEPGTRAQAPAEQTPAAPAAGGRRRPALLVGAAAVVAVLVLGAAITPGIFGSGPAAPPPPPVQLNPAVHPVDDAGAPKPTRQGIESQLAGELRNPALGTFSGTVVDARTGETLWAREPGRGMVPGSTTKVLTSAAAMLTLDPDHRFTTKVVQGSEPGSVVLVGGGDPTLSKLPAGRESVYGDVAHLDDLAAQVEQATGGDVESVQFDSSRYAGDPMGPSWEPGDIAGGYVAPIESMMLDGGRADPTAETSRRTQQPALQVAHGLASRLGLHGLKVSEGEAPQNGRVLGEVHSPTVRELVENMLQHSDNVMAEVMAREVAVATGHEPSFEGATQAVRSVLTSHGVDLEGTELADGSGMSTENRITPRALGSVLHLLAQPGQNGAVPADAAKLRRLLPGLPVAGGSGSLEDRYQGSDGRGWVRAKTGTLDGVNSLAGTVLTADGRVLVFALMSNGPSPTEARPALDAVAAGLRGCGCR